MGQVYNISPNEAHNILNSDQASLIDVREPAEYRAEKIKGAQNIPLSKITANHIQNKIDAGHKIILHCKSGRRSTEASKKLSKDIHTDIYNIQGGIDSWSELGFKTEISDKNILPLDRQVQLVVSSMILSGLAIYYFISPFGLILPLIAGLGLMTAAVTGWCGMARLLSKMPWNR